MTLLAAIDQFERSFTRVRTRAAHDKTVPILWSGGLADFDKAAPVLYPSSELAVKYWLETAMASTNCFVILEWLQRPELMEFQITVADKIGRHRMVDNKFSVKSQFTVMTDG